jgi:hypothetical protein
MAAPPSGAGVQTIICMRWGTAYGVEFVNKLFSMVRRHTERSLRFICFTDDPGGLHPEISARALPPIGLPRGHEWKPWRKIALWQRRLDDIEGDVLFLDLDVVVTGSIDDFFDYRPDATYCVIENWTQLGSGIGNTSVFRLRIGAHPEVHDALIADPMGTVSRFSNSQTFVSRTISSSVFWPPGWCLSFKEDLLPAWPLNFVKSARLPADARVVCFPGHPNPDEARDGIWPPGTWYKRLYKHVRPTPWIAEHWR